MMDWLSSVETDKVIHNVETGIVKLMVEIESFGMSSDDFDKEIVSIDELQLKQVDLSYVHALNKLHLHEIRVVLKVLMMDWLSSVETDKVIHNVKTGIVKLVVEIKSFGMSFDDFDKEIVSIDELQLKQVDLSYVHALNKLHLHEIRVVL
nr:hypothetical protein [Tanacetum cinerariifolium]